MGTPEFPDLGKHCSVDYCKQIDFLPFTCDRCIQVFCLDHRSYMKHSCPKGNRGDVTVVICPLCAKGVRLNPDEDPNITWEKHVNTDCDPSNYEKTVKKKKCPVPRCRELLTFSNTIKCRDCCIEHCLKHRFGPDHSCSGPKKLDSTFSFMGFLSTTNTKEAPASSSRWSSLLASAEASIRELGNDISQKLQFSSGGDGNLEKTQERNGKGTVDVCPKCSKGFRESGELLKHIDKDHRGTSIA
ncbi:unnamed protein product [Brassica oleracea]